MSAMATRAGRFRLTLDPTVCDGHGLCAALYPEGIALDDWGYPIVPAQDIPPDHEVHARRAVSACPALALRLARATAWPGRRPDPGDCLSRATGRARSASTST